MSYYTKVRNPNLTYLARKSLRKQIQDKCKKVSLCPHCGDINGTIKKCGLLKISHEKFRTRRPEQIMAAKLGKAIFVIPKQLKICFLKTRFWSSLKTGSSIRSALQNLIDRHFVNNGDKNMFEI